MEIESIHGRQILDSRGNPTVSTSVTLRDGSVGFSAVPSGASTGSHEAVELRDGDPNKYHGQGVTKAVDFVNSILQDALKGKNAEDQYEIDRILKQTDGTENKSNVGANALLSISLAVARAEAISEKKPLYAYLSKYNPDFHGTYILPVPEMNVLNGGKHANWSTDIQEFMIFPIGATSFSDAVRMNVEVYQTLKLLLKEKQYSILVGDEGGFAPAVASNEEPFQLLMKAIEQSGYKPGIDISLGIDAAANEFFRDGTYDLKKEGKMMSNTEIADFFLSLTQKYPLVSMEDIFSEDDWESFAAFTKRMENRMQIVGDDLYVTNVNRLQTGIDKQATNSILIKVNQIGTLSETIDAILLARKHNMTAIVSHRSGETEDTFIADFVVGMGTGQIKSGAPSRSERVAKYNRLLEIEEEAQATSIFQKFPFSS